jgi:hypothetical protein
MTDEPSPSPRRTQSAAIRLTRQMIAQSRVIAKGLRIRDVQRLIRQYGGTASGWTKKSSPIILRGSRRYEYHWYEHPGVGRKEIKIKQVRPR